MNAVKRIAVMIAAMGVAGALLQTTASATTASRTTCLISPRNGAFAYSSSLWIDGRWVKGGGDPTVQACPYAVFVWKGLRIGQVYRQAVYHYDDEGGWQLAYRWVRVRGDAREGYLSTWEFGGPMPWEPIEGAAMGAGR